MLVLMGMSVLCKQNGRRGKGKSHLLKGFRGFAAHRYKQNEGELTSDIKTWKYPKVVREKQQKMKLE